MNSVKVIDNTNPTKIERDNTTNRKEEEKVKISETWSGFTIYLLNNTDYDKVQRKLEIIENSKK